MRCPITHPMAGQCELDRNHEQEAHQAYKTLTANGQQWVTGFIWSGPVEVF